MSHYINFTQLPFTITNINWEKEEGGRGFAVFLSICSSTSFIFHWQFFFHSKHIKCHFHFAYLPPLCTCTSSLLQYIFIQTKELKLVKKFLYLVCRSFVLCKTFGILTNITWGMEETNAYLKSTNNIIYRYCFNS